MVVMKKWVCCLFAAVMLTAGTGRVGAETSGQREPSCDISKTTICTIEIWLTHKKKKDDKEIRGFLESKSIKVLRNTIQYWKPRGGHPPANVAIGSAISAEDARMIIDLAEKYNDSVDLLVLAPLNPPNYVAIATSAWDELSQIPVTPENLKALRDPKLTTEEFHALYKQLTGEKDLKPKFY